MEVHGFLKDVGIDFFPKALTTSVRLIVSWRLLYGNNHKPDNSRTTTPDSLLVPYTVKTKSEQKLRFVFNSYFTNLSYPTDS